MNLANFVLDLNVQLARRKMRDRVWTWIRRRRRALVKGSCLLLLLILLIFAVESRRSSAIAKSEADSEIGTFIGSRDSPSSDLVQPSRKTVIHNPSSQCNQGNGSTVLALFMVISSPDNSATRNVIRSGFKFYLRDYNGEIGGKGQKTKINTLLFFTGLPETPLGRRKLLNEAQLHGDLIIDDLKESYLNLSLKTLRMLKWVEQNCFHAEFTVKVDDDFHVNLKRFVTLLESLSRDGSGRTLIGGSVNHGAQPVRDPSSTHGKWYTPLDLWPRDTFPDYVAGFFYVLGQDARTKIYVTALRTPLFHLEDVFVTGIVAREALGLKLTDLPIISNFWTPLKNLVTSSCDLGRTYMGVHFHMRPFNYLECWKGLNDKDFVCSDWPLFTYCWTDP